MNRTRLTSVLEDLAFLAPSLTLGWRFAGDNLACEGLAGRIASRLAVPLPDVARYTGTFETATGPIDVEVALAWENYNHHPTIDSFVNLFRTRDHGAHVEGLIDGICDFLGTRARQRVQFGLTAAVAVILTDVKFGNPAKDRLDSEEAQAPVAEATKRALEAWALARPEHAKALRARIRTKP